MDVPTQDFKRGTLIVRFTDYKGQKQDPIVYTNFLEALAYPGADTRIQLYEEGDYEVSLDYEIVNDKWVDKLYNYKIAFKFQIRNSNTMVYAKDISTKSYLANDSVTENGFVLDWAESHYLKVNIQLSQWTKGVNGYTEDIIFNREAKESDQYVKTGIYTYKIYNPATDPNGNNATIKKIYVGTDNVLIAAMKNSSYSINQISNMVDNEGYQISRTGNLIPPVVTELTTTTTTATTEQTSRTTALTTESTQKDTSIVTTTQKHDSSTSFTNSIETTITMTETNVKETEEIINEPSEKNSLLPYICIGGTGVLSLLAFVLWKSKKA
jgi:hypothetical protein